MLQWTRLLVLSAVLLVSGCVLPDTASCSVDLDGAPVIVYTITNRNTAKVLESSARVGAASVITTPGNYKTLVRIEDTGLYKTEITMEINTLLAVGETLSYDATADYASDDERPMLISGRGPDDTTDGLYQGELTITALSETTFSGRFNLRYDHKDSSRLLIEGEFEHVMIQVCR